MELPWDGARTVCRENGGDLAKLEDLTFSELIKRYEEESDIDENIFLYKDYWVGLRGDGNDNFFWVFDCTLLQNSIDFNLTSIGNNNNCFLRHAGGLRTGKRVQCSVKKPFVCQRYTDEMCKVDDVFMADISNILTTITYDECMDYCIYDTSCTDIIFIANSSCYLLQTSPLYSGEMQIASKSCIRVSINETMITTIAETTKNFCNVTLAIQSSSPTSYITQSTAVSSELQISSTVSSLLETSNWLQSSQCVTITETEVISLPCESTLPSTSPTPSITQSTSFASLTPSSFGTPFSASETILISSAETDDLEVQTLQEIDGLVVTKVRQ
ncbi:uncharacterized protein LOC123547787 [Mercenaria mercenaria]|uniref:uncharacterized protein LOC123547787 n=1 Tax=Mercenaria mercenaria TaxID=6596 RepID=UPI00234EE759|nr:uncharacterized protein LOC123547787 [Mercenaria mercenaria]